MFVKGVRTIWHVQNAVKLDFEHEYKDCPESVNFVHESVERSSEGPILSVVVEGDRDG